MKKTYIVPQVEDICIFATATMQAVSTNTHIDGVNIPLEGEGD